MSAHGRTIEVLLVTARELLVEASKLAGRHDEWWEISHVTKTTRPPLAIPDEEPSPRRRTLPLPADLPENLPDIVA